MIVRAVISTKRRDFAIAAVVFYSTACTSMLGIDGDYAAGAADSDTGLASGGQETGLGGRSGVPAPTGGRTTRSDAGSASGSAGPSAGGKPTTPEDSNGGAQPVGPGGSPGAGGAGGGTPGAGGYVPSSGGSPGPGTGGAAPPDLDAGGVAGCPTGTFTGSYRGTHKPGATLSVLNAPIAGDVTLRFSGTSGVSATVNGSFLDPLDNTGGVAAALRGTFDCAKGTGTLTLSPAQVTTLVPFIYTAQVEGSVDINLGRSNTLSGHFTIQETENSMATGSGSWSASP
jgi:hypothetical protein